MNSVFLEHYTEFCLHGIRLCLFISFCVFILSNVIRFLVDFFSESKEKQVFTNDDINFFKED